MDLSFGDRVGIAGLIMALFGIGITILWPTKRWLGWVFLAAGISGCLAWAWLEFRPPASPKPNDSATAPSKAPSASEIANELAKHLPKVPPPRSHLSITGTTFVIESSHGPFVNIFFKNDGALDAHFQEFSSVSSDHVFFNSTSHAF